MSLPDSKNWLDAGIAAVRSGDKESARAMLTRVVEIDERNEQAWLWLSVVAQTLEDRRICLENVLALNPESGVAKKGLAQLDRLTRHSSDQVATDQTYSISEGDLSATTNRQSGFAKPAIAVAPKRENHIRKDVWDSDEDICAYCASRVSENDRRCPKCRRSLILKRFRYSATAVLHIYWVFLFFLALILGVQAMFKYRFEQRPIDATFHAGLAILLILAVIGVNLRLFLAHIVSIFTLILVMILGIYNFLIPFDAAAAGIGAGDVALRGLTTSLLNRFGLLLETIQVVLGGAVLFYATLRASPEFERTEERIIARTEKGLQTAVDYHMVARRLKQQGKWASAVLHWQRAAAIDPNKVVYQRDLARAYIHLGFQARALDVLRSARELPMQPSIQNDVDSLYTWVQNRVTPAGKT